MTGRDLVAAALRKIGVLAQGATPTAGEATEGIAEANRMIGTWANDGIVIPAVYREEFALTAGDHEYSMGGVSADFDTTRPSKVVRASIEDQTSSPTLEHRLDVLGAERWAEIQDKESGNAIPSRLYVDGGFPNRSLYFWPKPQANLKAVLYSERQLATIALNTDIQLAAGYEDALVLGLAVRLAPEYGRVLDPKVERDADKAYVALDRANHRESLLKVDDALIPSSGKAYDILTGGRR